MDGVDGDGDLPSVLFLLTLIIWSLVEFCHLFGKHLIWTLTLLFSLFLIGIEIRLFLGHLHRFFNTM